MRLSLAGLRKSEVSVGLGRGEESTGRAVQQGLWVSVRNLGFTLRALLSSEDL